MTFFIFFKPNITDDNPPVILPNKGYLGFKSKKKMLMKASRVLTFKKNRFKR